MGETLSVNDGLAVRKSGPWVQRKYYFHHLYCEIFTTAMRKKWHLVYLDMFAGPGRCLITETKEEIEGSVIKALQYPFHEYHCVEKDKALLNALKKRCRKSPKFSLMHFYQGDCNVLVEKVIRNISNRSLIFAFIDPAKINIKFETIQQLVTKHPKVDLLINIMDGVDLKRNWNYYKKKKSASPLTDFLGPDVQIESLRGPRDAVEAFKNQIEMLDYKTVKYRDISVKNTKNAHMYYLWYASRHDLGLKFWNEITKRDEQGQGELF